MGLDQRDSDGFRLRPDGERLRFVLTVMPAGESAEIAELYKGYWEDIGIELVNKPGNWEQIGPMLTSGEYDLIMWPFGLAGRPMNPLVRGEVVSTSYYLPNMQWNAWLKSGGESGDEPPEAFKEIAEIRERAIRMPSEAARIVHHDGDIPDAGGRAVHDRRGAASQTGLLRHRQQRPRQHSRIRSSPSTFTRSRRSFTSNSSSIAAGPIRIGLTASREEGRSLLPNLSGRP